MGYSFRSWERRRQRGQPEADRALQLIASAGGQGVTRRELGHALALDREVLDRLLAGLIEAGLVTVTWEDALVYRCRNAALAALMTATADLPSETK